MNQHQSGRYSADQMRHGKLDPLGAPKNPNEYVYVSGYGFASPPPIISERRMLRSYSTSLGIAILAFLFGSSLFYRPIYGLLRSLDRFIRLSPLPTVSAPTLAEMASGFSYLVALLLPFLVYTRHIRMPLHLALPMRAPNWRITLPAIPIALGVTVVGVFSSMAIGVVLSFFGLLPTAPDFSAPTAVETGIVYFINSAVFPAIAEEIVFRGIMMQSLRRFGDAFALLISSILFGAVHGNFIQAPNALLAGLVIGYFVLRTGSLWTGILIHFVNNTLAIILGIATSHASLQVQMGATYLTYLIYILAGVVALMMLVREHSNLFVFRPAETVSTESEKMSCFFTSAGMLSALGLLAFMATRYLEIL